MNRLVTMLRQRSITAEVIGAIVITIAEVMITEATMTGTMVDADS
jgi:hypothetical protein